jgi:hypothetical protein
MLMGVALCPACKAGGDPHAILHADLAFHFVCDDKARTTLERNIEGFLRSKGFQVLNQARTQQEHGVFLFDLHIIGLDGQRRVADFLALPDSAGRYAVTLNTPPPTQRSGQLEESLLEFVSDKLGCQVRQVNRQTNGAEAKDFHDREIRRIEGLFRQEEELQGNRRL